LDDQTQLIQHLTAARESDQRKFAGAVTELTQKRR
jgi:hypothetical protein